MPPLLKPAIILKRNVDHLLTTQHKKRHDLAQWCRIDPSWVSAVLNDPSATKTFSMHHLGAIADFFGVEPYQLLMPGLSLWSERRSGRDRRSGHERRQY